MNKHTVAGLFERFMNNETAGTRAQRFELFLDTIEIVDLETLNKLEVTVTAQRGNEQYELTDVLSVWRANQGDSIHNDYYSQMRLDKQGLKEQGYKGMRFWLELHHTVDGREVIEYIGTLQV